MKYGIYYRYRNNNKTKRIKIMQGLTKVISVGEYFAKELEVVGRCRAHVVLRHHDFDRLFYADAQTLMGVELIHAEAETINFKNWHLSRMTRIVDVMYDPIWQAEGNHYLTRT
jgi:hypothetical protein